MTDVAPLRIAEIAPPWLATPPRGYGGIELVVDLLARRLQRRGHEVTLFAPEGSESEARVVSPLAPAGAARIDDPWFETYHTVSAYLRSDEFDVMHDHTFIGTALAAVRRGDAVVVHTLHRPWTDETRRHYGLVQDRVHLVAISDAQRRANDDVRYAAVIPNGIDLDAYPLSSAPREDFLVYIGRATADKAPDTALEVAHRAGLPLKLLVKRSEPGEVAHWQRVVEPLLGPDDEVLAELEHGAKVELLQRGRAFVFPIRWDEPFGLVVVEAMACGMPVVATPRGAVADLVVDGETGFLRENVDGLVAAVDRVGDISPRACRAHVERHYSAEAMVAAYERLFGRLAARR